MNQFEEEIRLKRPSRSKAGNLSSILKTSGLHCRFSNPNYIKDLSSGRSEAVMKVISYRQGYEVRQALEYIARTDTDQKKDLECEDHLAAVVHGKRDIAEVYEDWKKDFKPVDRQLQRKQRDAAHIMFSSDCKNSSENNRKVLAAARKVIAEEFADKGHDYVLAIHADSGNPHVHAVVKCKNRFRGQGKLRINPSTLFALRTKFSANLRNLGLDHVATLRQDRPDIMERVTNALERLKKDERQFQRAMRRASPSKDAFLYRKNVLQTIVRLREQIKKETVKKSPERLKFFGALRKMERQLTNSRPDIGKEIAVTFKQYSKDFAKFTKTLSIKPAAELEKSKLEALIERKKTYFKNSIVLAREYINESGTPDRVKKESLAVLSEYEKNMKLAFRKDLLKCKNKEFKEVFRELNRIAKQMTVTHEYKPETARERLNRTRELDNLSREFDKNVMAGRQAIRKASLPKPEKQSAMIQINKFVQNFNRRSSQFVRNRSIYR